MYKPLVSLLTGQAISVMLAMTGYISTKLADSGFVFPVLQSSGFYFLLSLFLLSRPFPLKGSISLYALLALLDVEANFLAVFAYQYTDATSISLLNSLTIPWIVLLSFIVLKRKYSVIQLVSISISLGGLGLVIASDTLRGRWDSGGSLKSAWIGDVICVGSSFLYACQNVLQEYVLKKLGSTGLAPNREYLGMLGFFGLVISSVQWLILERAVFSADAASIWSGKVIGLVVGFDFTMLSLYMLLAWFIIRFDASLFNMNILTSGVYGILIAFADKSDSPHRTSDWMYIAAYLLVVTGVIMYCRHEMKSSKAALKSESVSSFKEPENSFTFHGAADSSESGSSFSKVDATHMPNSTNEADASGLGSPVIESNEMKNSCKAANPLELRSPHSTSNEIEIP